MLIVPQTLPGIFFEFLLMLQFDVKLHILVCTKEVKFIYSEEATKFCEIYTIHLTVIT